MVLVVVEEVLVVVVVAVVVLVLVLMCTHAMEEFPPKHPNAVIWHCRARGYNTKNAAEASIIP